MYNAPIFYVLGIDNIPVKDISSSNFEAKMPHLSPFTCTEITVNKATYFLYRY